MPASIAARRGWKAGSSSESDDASEDGLSGAATGTPEQYIALPRLLNFIVLRVLEETLRARGLTTGHSPQSQPLAQYGGLVATRSIGQLSTLYGGIEDMVAGLEAVLAGGEVVRIRPVPRRAAGPDLRHVVIGNEGALAFVTEVTVKVFRVPEHRRHLGYLVPDLATGVELLREIVTAGHRPSVCRVYDSGDAGQHFDFVGDLALVVVVTEGPRGVVEATSAAVEAVAGEAGARPADPAVIESWFAALNWGPDKIEAEKAAMLDGSNLGYTTEVAAPWSRVGALYDAVMLRIAEEFPRAERPHPAGGALVAQLPGRHQPLLRLRLRHPLRAARGDRPLPPAPQRDRGRGGAAGRRHDRAPPRCRQVPHRVDPAGARLVVPAAGGPQARPRPTGRHEPGHPLPAVTHD